MLPGCAALNVARESAYSGVGGGLGAFFGPLPAFLGAFFMDLFQQAVRGAEVQQEATKAAVDAIAEGAPWWIPDTTLEWVVLAFVLQQLPTGRATLAKLLMWFWSLLKKKPKYPEDPEPPVLPPAYSGPGDTVPK